MELYIRRRFSPLVSFADTSFRLSCLMGELQCLTHCFLWTAPQLKRDCHWSTGQRWSKLFFNHLTKGSQGKDKNSTRWLQVRKEEEEKSNWDPQACKAKTCHSWDCFQVIVKWEETEALLFFFCQKALLLSAIAYFLILTSACLPWGLVIPQSEFYYYMLHHNQET